MEDFEFPDDFDEEDYAEIDALIEYLNTLERPEVEYLDDNRLAQMKFCAATMKRVLRETKSLCSIECTQNEFEPSMGVVNVEAKTADIVNTEYFARAAEFASNTEVYPLLNGKTRITFTFHDLLKPLE